MTRSCKRDLNAVAKCFAMCDQKVADVAKTHGLSYEDTLEEIEDRKVQYYK